MPALITVTSTGGKTRQCDAHCYDAKEPVCTCVCGGLNHGAGLKAALDNTQAHYKQLVKQIAETHPESAIFHDIQEALFGKE